jgi:3-methyladenine DNA glycosylase Tag
MAKKKKIIIPELLNYASKYKKTVPHKVVVCNESQLKKMLQQGILIENKIKIKQTSNKQENLQKFTFILQ